MAGISECLASLLAIAKKRSALTGRGQVKNAVDLGLYVEEELDRLHEALKAIESECVEVDEVKEALDGEA
jgi:hypothetical protein